MRATNEPIVYTQNNDNTVGVHDGGGAGKPPKFVDKGVLVINSKHSRTCARMQMYVSHGRTCHLQGSPSHATKNAWKAGRSIVLVLQRGKQSLYILQKVRRWKELPIYIYRFPTSLLKSDF